MRSLVTFGASVLPCVTCVSCVRPHATPIRAIMIALLLSIKQPEFVCITRTPSYHDSCVCCRSSNRSLRVCIITPSPCFARFHCQPSSFRSLCVFDNGAVALPLRQHGSKDPEFVTSSSIRSLSHPGNRRTARHFKRPEFVLYTHSYTRRILRSRIRSLFTWVMNMHATPPHATRKGEGEREREPTSQSVRSKRIPSCFQNTRAHTR